MGKGSFIPLDNFENYGEIPEKEANYLLPFGVEKLKGYRLQ